MPRYLQWLRYGWLPAVTLAAFAAQHLSWFDFHSLLTAQLPLALLGVALVLATFFKSSRVAFSAALILAVYLGIDFFPWLRRDGIFPLCLGLAALNIAMIAFTRDRSPLNGFGLLLLLVLLGQGAGLFLLQGAPLVADWSAQLELPVYSGIEIQVRPTPLLFVSALLLLLLKVSLRPEHTGFGLLACVLLLFLARENSFRPLQLQMAASAAGLLLTLLVLRSAYELAFRDELTGIPSRRAYSRYLLTLGRHFSVAVIDIDHFKKLNDRHGHQVGDQALRMVAGRIARFGGGHAFRYGGEEFVVVFRGRDRERPLQSLEQMREKIADYPLRLRSVNRDSADSARARRRRGQGGGKVVKTTVSVGIASSGGKLKSPDEVLEAADRALYKAKRSGRNRVCAHT